MNNQRIEIASGILAGFAANPAIFAHHQDLGLVLVNFTNSRLAQEALMLADELIEEDKNTKKQVPVWEDKYEKSYYELLYAVSNKYPGETRHQTALRYILERENRQLVAQENTADKPKHE